jgi:DNA modification methylase
MALIQANASALPFADNSVDLIVTSPPFFGLRSYTDGGAALPGQVGAEQTPAAYVDSLITATREWTRVLKPTGSMFINLGDKYSGAGRGNNTGDRLTNPPEVRASRLRASNRRQHLGLDAAPPKSLIGLPWRYALRCIDDLGLILRAELIWSKPNGLPESVTDRVRRSHETWFHLVRSPRYFSAIDAIREPYSPSTARSYANGDGGARIGNTIHQHPLHTNRRVQDPMPDGYAGNPLGKLPGSVWSIASQPFKAPPELGVDHFAAFPLEWPRRLILGWSPDGVCTACGDGRRPVVAAVGLDMSRPQARRAHALAVAAGLTEAHFSALLSVGISDTGRGAATQNGTGKNTAEVYALADVARSALGGYAREYLLRRPTGYRNACGCPDASAPTRPAVVLDPFGGTGTTALVAATLGRLGISVDLSADYCRLAAWRTSDPAQRARAAGRRVVVRRPRGPQQSAIPGLESF